jgi:phage tail sheath protein FI
MAVTVSYPGVYVEEFAPAAPIQGVATSIAAFLGPAASGPLLEPQLVTSWDAFTQIYGRQPVSGFHLWYAVRGFFENEGRLAYIVRISNAAAASATLLDRAAGAAKTVVVQALKPGAGGNAITVEVLATQALKNMVAFKHSAPIAAASGTAITFATADEAAKFRPGDNVRVAAAPAPRAQVVKISNHTVTLSQPLPSASAPGAALRISDLQTADGDAVIRFLLTAPDKPVHLVPGTILSLSQGAVKETAIVEAVALEYITLAGPPLVTYRVKLRAGIANDYGLAAADAPLGAKSNEFDLVVTDGTLTETFPFLLVDPASPRSYGALVNNHSQLVSLAPAQPPPSDLPPANLPKAAAAAALTGGTDEVLGSLLPSDYQNGLDALENITVNIVAIPDRQDAAVQGMLLDHCQGSPPAVGNRFAVLDSARGALVTGAGSIADQIAPLAGNGLGFAALYYPWVLVPPAPPAPGSPPPPVAPPNVLVPPSGHVVGVYARIDNSRGVHKAPAGIEANLHGTIGVERLLGDTEQGLLNMPPYGVNVIRVFRGGQPTIWGTRTNAVAAGNTNWQYVNIRRLFIFLEASITAGIRFAVFEPNNLELWGKLKRSISAFLTKVWRDGALFGATPKDAFYVRIDEALNPPDQLALGYLVIEIGVRPSYPAEFIIVRIGIWPGGASVTEV